MNKTKTTSREFFVASKAGVRHRVTQTTRQTSSAPVSARVETWSKPYTTYHLSNGVELKKQADGTFKIPGSDDVFTVEQ